MTEDIRSAQKRLTDNIVDGLLRMRSLRQEFRRRWKMNNLDPKTHLKLQNVVEDLREELLIVRDDVEWPDRLDDLDKLSQQTVVEQQTTQKMGLIQKETKSKPYRVDPELIIECSRDIDAICSELGLEPEVERGGSVFETASKEDYNEPVYQSIPKPE